MRRDDFGCELTPAETQRSEGPDCTAALFLLKIRTIFL